MHAYITKASLELLILVPPAPMCWVTGMCQHTWPIQWFSRHYKICVY